jgi:hypothetical protein
MRLFSTYLLLAAALPAAELAVKPSSPVPYVVRVLALGHDPERKFKLRSDGLYEMMDTDMRELPPREIFVRPPAPTIVLPGAKPPTHIACGLQLNGVQQTILPATILPDDPLPLELEVVAPPVAGAKGPPEKSYKEIGEIKRTPESTSSLVILYNPAGQKTWDGVKPFVIDTSEVTLPVGSILVYNLCRESLSATIGGNNGVLASGQSALVRPKVSADSLFELRLLLAKSSEDVQLIDSVRGLPPGSRAFLIIHPVPISRNSREADFVLFVIPADPKPEPIIAPVVTSKPVR